MVLQDASKYRYAGDGKQEIIAENPNMERDATIVTPPLSSHYVVVPGFLDPDTPESLVE